MYLDEGANPRWVAKPAVAYLWARTAACGNCRAEIPLLKTRWLCKKAEKRILLSMEVREDGRGMGSASNGASPKEWAVRRTGASTTRRSAPGR